MIIKEGDRGVVFGYTGTVLSVSDRLLSFEADALKGTTRPVLVVPVTFFEKTE